MPLRITRVIGNRFLPESCDDVHTHFKRNWYELAGQPGVAISTARRNCDAGFCGERSADSRVQRELEFAVQYARTRLPRSALCDEPLSGASSKAWRGSTRMSSANLKLSARRVLQT